MFWSWWMLLFPPELAGAAHDNRHKATCSFSRYDEFAVVGPARQPPTRLPPAAAESPYLAPHLKCEAHPVALHVPLLLLPGPYLTRQNHHAACSLLHCPPTYPEKVTPGRGAAGPGSCSTPRDAECSCRKDSGKAKRSRSIPFPCNYNCSH